MEMFKRRASEKLLCGYQNGRDISKERDENFR